MKKTMTFAVAVLWSAVAVAQTVTATHVQSSMDKVPRFVPPNAITSVAPGNWNSPTTWSGNQVPGQDAKVRVKHVVNYDQTQPIKLDCVEVDSGGALVFSPTANTKLWVHEIQVMPGAAELIIGTEQSPITGSAEVVFRHSPGVDFPQHFKTGTLVEPGIDPSQYGCGLLVYGKIRVHGKARTQFVRLAGEAMAGHTVLSLESAPTGWQAGDRVVIPDTRQIKRTAKQPLYTSEAEEKVVASVSGAQVHLTTPLAYNHVGPKDATGNLETGMLPHVANLTRNVVFRSENPAGVRGHTQYFERADVDIRHAAFVGLGRTTNRALNSTTYDENGNVTKIGTNQIGRYSIHDHHRWGPLNPANTGYQARYVGNVVEDFMKWGITLHASHYGLVSGNVVYNGRGSNRTSTLGLAASGIATEDGSESFNVIEANLVIHTGAGTQQRILASAGVGMGGVTSTQEGVAREGFWLRGMHNYVRNNVAANCPEFGFNYNGLELQGYFKVPKFRGADMMNPAQYTLYNGSRVKNAAGVIEGIQEGLPLLEFSGNEAYGAIGQALWISRPQGHFTIERYAPGASLFERLSAWHFTEAGVFDWGEDTRSHFVGFKFRNDPTVSAGGTEPVFGMTFGATYYTNGRIEIRDCDISGCNVGIRVPHTSDDNLSNGIDITLVADSKLANHVNIVDVYARWTSRKDTLLRNISSALLESPVTGIPAAPLHLWMFPDQSDAHTKELAESIMLVEDWQGNANADFRAYFHEQRADYVIPPYHTSRGAPDPNAPGVGMTNAAALAALGICICSEISPADAADGAAQGIHGLILGTSTPPPDPVFIWVPATIDNFLNDPKLRVRSGLIEQEVEQP